MIKKTLTLLAFMCLCNSTYSFFGELEREARLNVAYQEQLRIEAAIRAEKERLLRERLPYMIIGYCLKTGWFVIKSTGKFTYTAITDPEQAVRNLRRCKAEDVVGFLGTVGLAGGTLAFIIDKLTSRPLYYRF